MVRLTRDEPVGRHLAVADQYQPVLVIPARIAGACGAGESEVRPIPADLARHEREKAGRAALSRVGDPARQPVDDQLRTLRSQPQVAIDAAQPGDELLLAPGASYSGRFVLRNKGSSTSWITTSPAGIDGGSGSGRHRPRRVFACGAPRAAALHRTRTRWMVITAHPDAQVAGATAQNARHPHQGRHPMAATLQWGLGHLRRRRQPANPGEFQQFQ